MKKHGHYCKICGEYKANEKFSGKGHAAHICKSCASLPAEKQAELMTLNRLLNLPWRLSKEQLSWLKNRLKDRRPDVRALAQEQYEMRFPPRHLEDDERVHRKHPQNHIAHTHFKDKTINWKILHPASLDCYANPCNMGRYIYRLWAI